MGTVCSGPKTKRTTHKAMSRSLWCCRSCISVLGTGHLHLFDGRINAEKNIEILEQHVLPATQHLFQGRPCIFQRDNAKSHPAHTAEEEEGNRCWTGLPAALNCSQQRTHGEIWSRILWKHVFPGRMGQNKNSKYEVNVKYLGSVCTEIKTNM